MCSIGKKIGFIHMEETQNKKYICTSCSSKSEGEAGTCCGADRKEACSACGKACKDDGTCDCGGA